MVAVDDLITHDSWLLPRSKIRLVVQREKDQLTLSVLEVDLLPLEITFGVELSSRLAFNSSPSVMSPETVRYPSAAALVMIIA